MLQPCGVFQQALREPRPRNTSGLAMSVAASNEVWDCHGMRQWGIYPPSSMRETSPSLVFHRGGNIPRMSSELDRDALKSAMKERGLTMRALSLRVGTNSTLVRDIINSGSQNPRMDSLAKLAEALDVPLTALLRGGSNEGDEPHRRSSTPTVRLLGLARANPDGSYVMTSANESHARVPIVPGATSKAVALQVAGGSMHTKAPDGSLIYFDEQMPEPPAFMIGEACVVETEDGRVLFKYLQRGSEPGLFDLVSDLGEPIRDIRLRWVAEVLAIVPARHARRILIQADIEAA